MQSEVEKSIKSEMRKAYILETSNACMVSIYGLAKFRELFLRNNWQIVDKCSKADLILVNSCGFNQAQEDKTINKIKRIKKDKKPEAEIIVSGCLPKINEKSLNKVFDGITFSPKEIDRIDELIDAKIKISEIKNIEIGRKDFQGKFLYSFNKILAKILLKLPVFGFYKFFHIKIEPYYKILNTLYDHRIFYILACTGCLGNCSYCAIKRAKGTLKSIPVEKIISEFRYGLSKGYKKFALIGDDLGYYGRDIKSNLITLLEEMIKEKGDFELLLYYLEPMDFETSFPKLKEVFRSGKIVDVCIPVQTGSNRITKLMNRPCDVENVRKYASELRKEFQFMNVRTHVIVGFPGETEEDFKKSLELFDDFDEVGIFKYADRPDTPASRMTNKVPDAIINDRMKRIKRKFLYDLYFKKLINIKFIFEDRLNTK